MMAWSRQGPLGQTKFQTKVKSLYPVTAILKNTNPVVAYVAIDGEGIETTPQPFTNALLLQTKTALSNGPERAVCAIFSRTRSG